MSFVDARRLRSAEADDSPEGAWVVLPKPSRVHAGEARRSTVDVDIRLVPEVDSVLRAILRIKEELRINVELAAPDDFIPVPAGWEGRSLFVALEGVHCVW
jgi:hypothetical protein